MVSGDPHPQEWDETVGYQYKQNSNELSMMSKFLWLLCQAQMKKKGDTIYQNVPFCVYTNTFLKLQKLEMNTFIYGFYIIILLITYSQMYCFPP